FARLAVSDSVRQHDEVARRIENLASAEELTREGLREKSRSGSTGAVKDQHGVAHDAGRVALRRADGPVMEVQLGQALAAAEREVVRDEVSFDRCRVLRRMCGSGQYDEQDSGG